MRPLTDLCYASGCHSTLSPDCWLPLWSQPAPGAGAYLSCSSALLAAGFLTGSVYRTLYIIGPRACTGSEYTPLTWPGSALGYLTVSTRCWFPGREPAMYAFVLAGLILIAEDCCISDL
ncbi:MAG: hypothetical protein MZV63_23055 [Marinilabiliales bacterium]|nr:hypothetical protein [Marinilabiliales bacterium]